MAMPGIVIQIGADTADAIKGIKDVNGALGDQTGAQKFKAGVDKAFVPALAVLGGLTAAAWDFSKAAMEDQASASKLAVALKNTTKASDAQIASVEDWISATAAATGIADDQLRPALSRLVASTKDVTEAQKLANLATEIATAKGLSAETVANALAKANDGQFAALKKLGVSLGEQTTNAAELVKAQNAQEKAQLNATRALEAFGPQSKEYQKAMAKVGDATNAVSAITQSGVDWVSELGAQFGGSVAANAETAEGKMARLTLAIDETKEGIGAALLPVIEQVLPYVQRLAEWAQKNADVLFKVGAVIAGVAGVIVTLKAAIAAWTAVQWLLNAALAANPIGLVVIAIAALVAGVIVAYNKFDWFKNIVDTAWQVIETAIKTVVNWFVNTAWPKFQGALTTAGAAFETFKDAVTAVWKAVSGAVQTAWDTIKGIVDNILGAVKTAIDAVANLPGVSHVVGWVSGRSSRGLAPGMSTRAVGGVSATSNFRSLGGGGATVININMGVGDPVAIAREIDRVMAKATRRVGVA